MATLTIRSFPDKERDRLREQASANGRSMEAEARRLVLEGLGKKVVPPKAVDSAWLKNARRLVAKVEGGKGRSKGLLTPKERRMLKPDAQAALQRLREMFADRKGQQSKSMVDDFLAGRREMWGEE